MMMFGWKIQFQIDTYVSMSCHSQITSVPIPLPIQIGLATITHPQDVAVPYYELMDLSDISSGHHEM